jgi:hypothetical protein
LGRVLVLASASAMALVSASALVSVSALVSALAPALELEPAWGSASVLLRVLVSVWGRVPSELCPHFQQSAWS